MCSLGASPYSATKMNLQGASNIIATNKTVTQQCLHNYNHNAQRKTNMIDT